MAVFSPVNKEDLLSFLQKYDIGTLEKFEGILEGIENTNYKITTSKDIFILTIFEKRVNIEDLPFFINLQNHLAHKNFKCPQPITNKEGKSINILNGKPAVIISFLHGKKASEVTPQHCQQVGSTLSFLHQAAKDFKQQRTNGMHQSQWSNLFGECQGIKDHPYMDLIKPIEEELLYLDQHWPKNLPQGIIHADVFQDNVFFKDNQFSGLIDFYFACHDFLAYDIAITVNAWCFNNKGKFDNDKFQSLIVGYQVNRLLSHDEKQSMPVMLRGAAIRILITRLYDQLYHPAGAFVIPKDPLEYFSILQFHQTHNFFEFNI